MFCWKSGWEEAGTLNLDTILMNVVSYSQKSLSFLIEYTEKGYLVTLGEA